MVESAAGTPRRTIRVVREYRSVMLSGQGFEISTRFGVTDLSRRPPKADPCREGNTDVIASSNMKQVTAMNFEAEVTASDGPIVVGFGADWCRVSRAMAPMIDELAREYEGRVAFCHVNVDEDYSLAARFDVRTVPTFLIFKDGAIVQPLGGTQPKSVIQTALDRHL